MKDDTGDCRELPADMAVRRIAANGPGRRGMARTYRRPGGLAVLVAAAAIGLAACSSGSSSPQVASLGTSSTNSGNSASPGGGNSTAAPPASSPAQYLNDLNKWAACMRKHGDTNQATPTIDASDIIHITIPLSFRGGWSGYSGQSGYGPGWACRPYIFAVIEGFQDSLNLSKPSTAELEKFSECMRTNGISNFPDPMGSIISLHGAQPGSDLDSNNPTLKKVAELCYKKTGVLALPAITPPPGWVDVESPAGS